MTHSSFMRPLAPLMNILAHGRRDMARKPSARRALKQLIPPSRRVILAAGPCEALVERLPVSGFVSPFDQEEQRQLAETFGAVASGFDDEGAARLEWVREDATGPLRLGISRVSFLDALTTNLAIDPCRAVHDSKQRDTRGDRERAAHELVSRLRSQVRAEGPFRDAADVLRVRKLANPIAVSVLLRDAQGRPGVVRRSSVPHVSSASYCATVTAGVSSTDFAEADPFLHCAQRETQEELGVDELDLIFDGIVIARQKLQPVFLYKGTMNAVWEDLAPTIAGAPDYHRESAALLAIPPAEISRAVAHLHLTDAASYQLWRCVQHQGRSGMQPILRSIAPPPTHRWRIC